MAISSLDELKGSLKDHPQAQDILEYIEAAIETEKQTGISGRRKANNEAQNLRKWKQAIEALGYDKDDVEGLDEWLKANVKGTPAPNTSDSNPEIEKLRKEFQKAQKALEEEKANASKIKQTADRRAIKAKLLETLRDKVYGPDLLADTLISAGQVRLAEDETVVFISGEEELDFDKGVKKLLESRPDLLKNTQAPGARSGSRPQAVKPTYTLDQLRSMTPEQIAADMDNVKASMRANKS